MEKMDTMTQETRGDVHLIKISGRVQQDDSIRLEEALEKALHESQQKIVIDLTDAKHICSTALGVLVSMKRRLRRNNGDIKLAVDEGDVKNLLQITMLDRVFELHENQESAIRACNE